MNRLSLVMIVKNEEKQIERCINSAKLFVDEIVVVDTGSSDLTISKAKNLGAHVYEFKWDDDFSTARNYAISKATGDWILSLDADEFILNVNRENLDYFLNQKNKVGRVKITSSFSDEGLIKYSQTYISRIFPKNTRYIGRIHEQLDTDLPKVNLDIEVGHDGYFETDKTDRNINLLKKELELAPDHCYYLFQMGKEYRNREEYSTAKDYLSKSYQLINRELSYAKNVILEYLNVCLKGSSFNEANQLIKAEYKYMAGSPDFHFYVGLFLMNYLMENMSEDTASKLSLIEKQFLICLEIGDMDQYESVQGTGSFLAAYNLGVFYEVTGNLAKAKRYYIMASEQGFQPALIRIEKGML